LQEAFETHKKSTEELTEKFSKFQTKHTIITQKNRKSTKNGWTTVHQKSTANSGLFGKNSHPSSPEATTNTDRTYTAR